MEDTSAAAASTHFVAEKVKALCVLSDVRYAPEALQDQYDFLPLLATGGWDNEVNHIALHLPLRPTRAEHELRQEFGRESEATRSCELSAVAEAEHVGDVNALQSVAARGENLLVSASSAGGVFVYRVASSSSREEPSDANDTTPLSALDVPQWANVFGRVSATCLDVSEGRTSVVAASAGGTLAWFKLDDAMGVEKIDNKNASNLAINGVKMLGRDSIVATVGSAPGSQLRVWDLTTSNQFPVSTCTDLGAKSVLTTLETHPTRPELLVTGADDGRVSFWDRRRLSTPFRTEAQHQRAVRALQFHTASPRYLYSGGDDAVVNWWDFHHGRSPHTPVEYERYPSGSSSSSASSLSLSTFTRPINSSNGFGKGPAGLQVRPMESSFQSWNTLAVHGDSDTLVAGSDAQSVLIVQQASKWTP